MKKNHKTRQPKDDNKQSPSVEKEIDASSESGKDKTPATKPAKGEVESSSTTPTKVVSATQNVAKPTSASSETTKVLFKLQQVLAKQKIMLHYKSKH